MNIDNLININLLFYTSIKKMSLILLLLSASLIIIGLIIFIFFFIFKFNTKKLFIKKVIVSILILIGVSLLIINGLGLSEDFEYFIKVKEITDKPSEFYNITSEQIQIFPSLQKAIGSLNSSIKISREEYRNLIHIFSNQNNTIIKYENRYYKILFSS